MTLAHITRRDHARIARERTEARAVKTFPGIDGRPVELVDPPASPWVARAQAGQLPASDRTFGR